MLNSENIELTKNCIWVTLEINWKEVSMTFTDNKVYLPRIITIKLRDKIQNRCMIKKKPLIFHVMLKQGITWFILSSSTQETV